MTDVSGTTQWTYDLFGRVVGKTQITSSVSLTIQYGYDATIGELKTITYPSGNVISLTYTDGKISDINSNRGTLMQNMTYDAFGPLKQWDWGNGDPMQRIYNQDAVARRCIKSTTISPAP
jgi:YD repeat-containing protein